MADLAYTLLKASMGRKTVPEEIEHLMRVKLEQAEQALRREGIEVDASSAADVALLAAYAEWLYSKREGDLKPRSLVEEIRDRQVAKSTRGSA